MSADGRADSAVSSASGRDERFRPDIEGLRAIAVLAVIAFHAGLAIPGGFVGVDIFFVISGYLITRQILAGTERGDFSLLHFFSRRIRRLLPAMITTILLTLAASAILLPPQRFAEVARSAAAAATAVSNVLFWRESSDYWADDSGPRPLLHTWSLGVEEQFYLVWPLALLLALRWLPQRLLLLLTAGTVLSFALTTWATLDAPRAAFYLMPFRAFEFLLGALCLWAGPAIAGRSSRRLQTGMWVAGAALIVVSLATLAEGSTLFPGWQALIPTLGTAMIIAAARPPKLDRVLSNPVATYLGSRSYSLYLAHWPVLVLIGEVAGGLDLLHVVGALAITAAAAELQYRFVERPLRLPSREQGAPWRTFRRRALPIAVIAAVIATGSIGAGAYAASPLVYPAEVRPLAELDMEALAEERRALTSELCATRSEGICGTLSPTAANILVLGDSFADDALATVHAAVPEANLLVSRSDGCRPVLDPDAIDDRRPDCDELNAARFARVADLADEIDVVVLANHLREAHAAATEKTIAWLVDQRVDVVVYGLGARYDEPPRQTILARGNLDGLDIALRDHLAVDDAVNDEWRGITERSGAVYLDRFDWMCGADRCRAFADEFPNLVMYDAGHMTRAGAAALGAELHDEGVELLRRAVAG